MWENTYDSAFEIYSMAGQLDSALAICERRSRSIPTGANITATPHMSMCLRARKKLPLIDFARRPAKIPTAIPWILRNRGYFYLYEGNYPAALDNFEQAIQFARAQQDSSNAVFAMMHRARLLTEMNRFDDAMKAYREVRDFSRSMYSTPVTPVDVIAAYGAGLTFFWQGDLSRAKKQALTIRRMVAGNGMDSLFNDYAYLLEAEIQLSVGDEAAAMESLDYVSNYSLNSPRRRLLESQVLAASGQLEQAVTVLRKASHNIVSRNSSQLGGDYFEYFYLRSFTPYLLGKFYQENGNVPLAIEYYKKAVEQWKHAAGDFPELKDAKTQLAKLYGKGV